MNSRGYVPRCRGLYLNIIYSRSRVTVNYSGVHIMCVIYKYIHAHRHTVSSHFVVAVLQHRFFRASRTKACDHLNKLRTKLA